MPPLWSERELMKPSCWLHLTTWLSVKKYNTYDRPTDATTGSTDLEGTLCTGPGPFVWVDGWLVSA